MHKKQLSPNDLRAHRKRKGFLQDDLAYLLECRDETEIPHYENGRRNPNLNKLLRLVRIYETSLSRLYFLSDIKETKKLKGRAIERLDQIIVLPPTAVNQKRMDSLKHLIDTLPVNEKPNRILAIDPVSRGYGFAILEDEPFIQLIDWSVVICRRDRRINCLQRIEMMIEVYEPNVIVLEDCADQLTRHCHAVNPFLNKIVKLAIKHKIGINRFSFDEVKETFAQDKASTKQEIAEALARHFPELTPKLPKPREIWTSEDYRMSIFNAVALGMTFLRGKHK